MLAISMHMYTYTWYTDSEIGEAAHDPSLGTGDFDTTSRYKRHNMNPRARCNVNGRGKWRWGCPMELMSSLVGFMTAWFSNDQYLFWWVERCFHLILYHGKKNHIRNPWTWSKWRFPSLTNLLLNGLFSAFTCRVSQERKEVLGPVSMGIPFGAPRFLAQCGVHHGSCRSCWNPGVLPRPPMIPQAMARCFDGWWNCRCLVGATLVICQAWLEVALVDTSW